MVTRRPKVPRATPAAPKSPDTVDGGDVIQADFGSSRAAHAHQGTTAPARSAVPRPGADPREPARQDHSPINAAPARTVPKNTTAKNTSAKNTGAAGPAPEGPGTQRAARPGTQRAARPGTAKPSKDGAVTGEHLNPVPAKAFSGRMLALFVVMIAITIMLAPTVKIYFEKRAEIAALEADISAKQSQQAELKRQVSRWQDPNYVKQQARDRINMVMPGETGYWVFGSDLPAGTPSGAAATGSQPDPADLPWVDSLWDSIRRSATD
ncbi:MULTISPECIES: septum formation initiator family protein [unclassified Arthrobacter]|uniref:septum formation initiator family protein n=1 Tax=unclassified Arthrobacter TaxID=235627 RepID=UPI002E0D0A1F|nr:MULTISPECIES: septum formation initiator family protein [unclassified Arthrobacter]MEC5190305.1 cell division protein FtsB [Arthrobacter sp. MP_M4]MEC5202678.1 cell division protein FtsB [Arthrobacter sp. MP_M7]